MNNIRHCILPYLIVIALTVVALLPLTHAGFFPIHDDEQVARLYDLDQDVHALHLPPRLAQDLGYGYDYPLFNFYPSFVYYVAEVFHLLGFSLITSTKLMIATGFIFSAVMMYLFSKEYFGRLGGIVSGALYTYASYHSVDVYIRGALAEAGAFVFLPAVFWSLTRLAKYPRRLKYIVMTAFFLCCFVLTHNLIAMMSAPFILAYMIYLFFTICSRRPFVLSSLLSIGISISLSAYFWLPELLERKYTMVNLLTKELADYALHFVYPSQFWYSPWGYGGSTAGMADGLSFQIGKVPIVLMLAVAGYAIYLVWQKKKGSGLLWLFIGLFVFSLFMQIEASKFIWDSLAPFAYIQFPWRYLMLTAFTSSFIAGAIFTLKLHRYIRYICAMIIIFFLFRTAVTIFHPQTYLTQVTDRSYTAPSVIRWTTSNESFEYVPNGIATKKSSRGNTIVAISQKDIAHSAISLMSGEALIKVTKDLPQEKDAIVQIITPSVLQLNVYDFPTWRIFTDQVPVSYTDTNRLKLLRFAVAPGTHSIHAVFTDTPVRMIGTIVSEMTAFCLVCFLFIYKKRGNTNP